MMRADFGGVAGDWLAPGGPDADVVISTRIRLARNVSNHKMPWRMKADEQAAIEAYLRDRIQASAAIDSSTYFNLSTLDEPSRLLLVERHLVSRELAKKEGDRGVIFSAGESTSVMINEEDHLRLQVIRGGLRIEECWRDIDRLDDSLSDCIDFAWTPELGYLTACPTNVGTGIRVSVMAHLPTLVETKQITKVEKAAAQVGLVIRGLYGEGTKSYGDLYQISNQVTLGLSEAAVIENVRKFAAKIIQWERGVRSLLLEQHRTSIDDKVRRSLLALRETNSISFDAAMREVSAVRLGVVLNLLRGISMQTINEVMLFIQPAHLICLRGALPVAAERDRVRADFIRERLKSEDSLNLGS